MNAELKVKWLEALRSGKYKQGRTYLRNNGAHCCLGVLCEVMGAEPEREFDYIYEGEISASGLAQSVLVDSGLKLTETHVLMGMNDATGNNFGRPQTFSQIADWIEERL